MKSVPVALEYASKPFKWLANTETMGKICKKFVDSPEKAIAYTTIASIVGKDSIGCYMYVNQSLHNEKIPEEKRSFVAALDLTNGGLMILSQLLMFFTISNEKVQKKLFGKFFDKIFSEKAFSTYMNHIRSKAEFATKSKEEIAKTFNSIKSTTENTFGFLTSLVASTILAKRVIVPFIATPMASWAQKKILGKNVNDDKSTQTEKTENQNIQAKEASNSEDTAVITQTITQQPSAELKEEINKLPNSNILKNLVQK